MLNSGKFTAFLQSGLCAEAANTATLLENNLITPIRTLSPFQQFFEKEKKTVLTLMQKFGEMCIATKMDNTHWAKLANCGTPSIWVGYTENHPDGTYKILTWDVTFLENSYSEYTQVEKPVIMTTSYEGSDKEEEPEMAPVVNNNNSIKIVSDSDYDLSEEDFKNSKDNFFHKDVNAQVKISPQTAINAKVVWAMKKLQTSYNVDANKIIKQAMNEKSAI